MDARQAKMREMCSNPIAAPPDNPYAPHSAQGFDPFRPHSAKVGWLPSLLPSFAPPDSLAVSTKLEHFLLRGDPERRAGLRRPEVADGRFYQRACTGDRAA